MEYPRKNATVATEEVGDGLAVLGGEQKQSYVLNATSALVFRHCDGQTSPEQLAELLRQKFNLPRAEAEQLTRLALEELQAAGLLEAGVAFLPPPPATFSRRQALTGLVAAGLSVALAPVVAKASGGGHHDDDDDDDHGVGHTLIPLLECVDNNGNGTYTAHFGYLNNSRHVIALPVGPKNMFVAGFPYRGQPILFHPGEHLSVFSVVFGAHHTLKWLLKAPGDRRHQVGSERDVGIVRGVADDDVADHILADDAVYGADHLSILLLAVQRP